MWLLTLEEECRLVGDQITGEILRCVHQTGDDGATQIGALQQIEEGRRPAHLRFDLDGSLDHGEGLLGLLSILAAEALDGAKRFCFAAAADEPPGRLGGEENEDEEWCLNELICGYTSLAVG